MKNLLGIVWQYETADGNSNISEKKGLKQLVKKFNICLLYDNAGVRKASTTSCSRCSILTAFYFCATMIFNHPF